MLYLQEIDQIVKRVNDKNITVCVVGVGTIGLPLATFLAHKGFLVRGLDVSEKRVEQINSGIVIYEYQDLLKKVIDNGNLKATTNPEKALQDVEAIFICVPTPLNTKNEMDISNLYDVSKKISPYLKKGMMVIFESSVAIGTTKQVSKNIEKMTELRFGKELGLAYCPERYNPTPMKKDKQDPDFNTQSRGESFAVDKISRVVGGIDEKSTKIAKLFYSEFISTEVSELSSIEAAEATKLLENIFRDVNIALVNELAKIYPKFGLDIFEIINAAKTKPFAYMPHYPGAGVGGECIPVDTWYLISQAEKLGIDSKLMKTARMVNDSMPDHVIELLEEELKKVNRKIDSSKVTVLGLCYKKNIPDIRLSPTFPLLEKLATKAVETVICDPVYEGIKSPINLTPINEAFKNSDAIILMTDHDDFKKIDFMKIKNEMKSHVIIDGRNLFKDKKLKELGFAYRVVGKP